MAFTLFPDPPVYVDAGSLPAKNGRSSMFGLFPGSPHYETPATQPAPSAPAAPKWVRIALDLPGAIVLQGAISEEFALKVGEEMGRVITSLADVLRGCIAPLESPAGEEKEKQARPSWEERAYERE